MKKSFVLFLVTFLLSSCFPSENWVTSNVVLKPDGITVIAKYRYASEIYFNEIESRQEKMLSIIQFYFVKDGAEIYLGKIDRTGVYSSKNNSLYSVPKETKEPYVSIRDINFPTSVNYIEFRDGKYQEGDTRAILKINLETLSLERVFP